MKTITNFKAEDVDHIAKLANIPVTEEEKKKLADGFNTVIKVVEQLNNVNVDKVEPIHQVTGMTNVFREDEIDTKRMFTQNQALANTKRKHRGYFVVNRVLENEDL